MFLCFVLSTFAPEKLIHMKKHFFTAIVVIAVSMGFMSCLGDEDTEWRDANIAFLEEISTQDGVKELGDTINGFPGIYYKVIKQGNGERPVRGNVVLTAYEGWLYNDTTSFDSSENYEFRLGSNVIEGWNLVIENMKVGDKWKVYIPYDLGYGTTGSTSTKIPEYSTLIFDIELKDIVSEN